VGLRAGLERCGISRPHRDSIPDRPARSQSLYRLSYPSPLVDLRLCVVNAEFGYMRYSKSSSDTTYWICYKLALFLCWDEQKAQQE
jgi:hypothetical protein